MATSPHQPGKLGRPKEPTGAAMTGRIIELRLGQTDGFIRAGSRRQIYFHRADLSDGTKFNSLRVGDAVTFELIEDAVSGARAIRVARRARS